MTPALAAETIGWRLAEVRARIEQACAASGRDAADVRLVPVSKTVDSAAVRAAHRAGAATFGENRVQELQRKAAELADVPDLRWAVIGPLQTNKAGTVAALADEFQALASDRVAEVLERRLAAAERQLEVLIQVNTSGDEGQSGLSPERVHEFAAGLARCQHLRVRGLMTIAAHVSDTARVAACFDELAALGARLRSDTSLPGSYHELSMGMSGDYELAIAHGSTCVRVGTAIFGSRSS